MIHRQNLSRDVWRQIGIDALTAAAAATGLVSWAIDEAKRALEEHRAPKGKSAVGEPPQG